MWDIGVLYPPPPSLRSCKLLINKTLQGMLPTRWDDELGHPAWSRRAGWRPAVDVGWNR